MLDLTELRLDLPGRHTVHEAGLRPVEQLLRRDDRGSDERVDRAEPGAAAPLPIQLAVQLQPARGQLHERVGPEECVDRRCERSCGTPRRAGRQPVALDQQDAFDPGAPAERGGGQAGHAAAHDQQIGGRIELIRRSGVEGAPFVLGEEVVPQRRGHGDRELTGGPIRRTLPWTPRGSVPGSTSR